MVDTMGIALSRYMDCESIEGQLVTFMQENAGLLDDICRSENENAFESARRILHYLYEIAYFQSDLPFSFSLDDFSMGSSGNCVIEESIALVPMCE